MQKIVFLLIIFLLVVSFAVQAQEDSPQYRLRVPTAEEYLSTVPSLIEQADGESIPSTFGNLVFDEIRWRFTIEELMALNADTLWDAFEKSLYLIPYSFEAISFWLFAVTHASLRELQLDLSQEDELTIRNSPEIGLITLAVRPLDFNGDGVDEYILNLTHIGMWNYFLVAQVDATQASGYRLFTTPLPVYAQLGNVGGTSEVDTVLMEDINGDGLAEWVVRLSTTISWTSMGKLYVVGWQDGELVDYAANGFGWQIPAMGGGIPVPEWEYTTQNEMTTITMHQRLDDGWGCAWDMVQTLDWNDTPPLNEAINSYEDTLYCIIREAERAFDTADYAQAIAFYEQALGQPQDFPQLTQFMQSRLVFAYAFNGQPDDALNLLAAAAPAGLMGELLGRMLDAYQNGQNLEAMCFAAHEFYVETNAQRTDAYTTPYIDFPDGFQFGMADNPHSIPLPIPAWAGCDITPFQDLTLTPTAVPLTAYESYMRNAGFLTLSGIFANQDYAIALERLNSIFASLPDSASQNAIAELTYWRALAFEFSGQLEEALAQYIAIYSAAPDSAWGQLAALHLEPIE